MTAGTAVLGAAFITKMLAEERLGYTVRGKVVLITGGSRGLGLLMAREFARRGARVAICARDGAELERARDDLRWRGHKCLALTCDVTDRNQVEDTIDRVRQQLGPSRFS
jgi:NAD(P)-dependent dehydrogenase (short-subunit alcohol dehydrogenase family)